MQSVKLLMGQLKPPTMPLIHPLVPEQEDQEPHEQDAIVEYGAPQQYRTCQSMPTRRHHAPPGLVAHTLSQRRMSECYSCLSRHVKMAKSCALTLLVPWTNQAHGVPGSRP